jgi:flavin-dependent dehydrogenase
VTIPVAAEVLQQDQPWDVVIVGAGPAGSMAALHLAEPGLRLLLVERDSFPRHKVCGCCLNKVAITRLEQAGLQDLPANLGATPLHEFQLLAQGKTAVLPLNGSYSLSRKAMDSALAKAAANRGATCLFETQAQLQGVEGGFRILKVRHRSEQYRLRSKLVLCADGLAGSCLAREKELAPIVAGRARIGVSAILTRDLEGILPAKLYMAVGQNGYAGLVRLEDGTLNIAAALDAAELSRARGPSAVIDEIFQEAGLRSAPDLKDVRWKGTAPLTRHRTKLGSERLLILGDAAGYVEPFTGEGIAWSLTSGQSVAPLARAAIEKWDPGMVRTWQRTYHRVLGRRQRTCRVLSRALRHRSVYGSLLHLLRWNPAWGLRIVEGINRIDWKGHTTV